MGEVQGGQGQGGQGRHGVQKDKLGVLKYVHSLKYPMSSKPFCTQVFLLEEGGENVNKI